MSLLHVLLNLWPLARTRPDGSVAPCVARTSHALLLLTPYNSGRMAVVVAAGVAAAAAAAAGGMIHLVPVLYRCACHASALGL